MDCNTVAYRGKGSATTEWTQLGRGTFGTQSLRLCRLHATGPVRVKLVYSAHDTFEETLVFDVARAETLVVLADGYTLHAICLAGTIELSWAWIEVTAHTPRTLEFNTLLPAGTYDSTTDDRLKPPAGATAVRIVPRDSATFEVELHDATEQSTSYDRADFPADGVPLGRADRVVLTAAGAVRLVYQIEV